MKCVRCLNDTAAKFAEAPDKSGAWEMYICSKCNFPGVILKRKM